MEGKGVYRFKNGDTYEGGFLKGFRYGEGKYQYKDGSFYNGEYRNVQFNKHKHLAGQSLLPLCDGLKHGFGVRVFASGSRYEGEWREDKMHGMGMLVTKDGAKFEGKFFNGLRCVLLIQCMNGFTSCCNVDMVKDVKSLATCLAYR